MLEKHRENNLDFLERLSIVTISYSFLICTLMFTAAGSVRLREKSQRRPNLPCWVSSISGSALHEFCLSRKLRHGSH